MKKIITHAGQFHADEVLGVALLLTIYIKDISIVERKFNVSQEELDDPEIFVIDVGKQYDPAKNNFDHHQDASLPASNMLLLDALEILEDDSKEFKKHLEKHLFLPVSNIDLGLEQATPASFNAIIRSYNILDNGFSIAVNTATIALIAAAANAEKALKDINTWRSLERPHPTVAVHHSNNILVNWKEHAYEDGVRYLITPNARGGYQVITRSSEEHPIPVDDLQTFRHNSGFLAVYPNYDICLEQVLNFC